MTAHASLSLRTLVQGHHRAVIMAIACAVLASCLEASPAIFIALITHTLLEEQVRQTLLMAAGMAACIVLAIAAQMGASLLSHTTAINIQASLRSAIGQRLLLAPAGRIHQLEAGSIRHALMNDVERIEDGIAHLIPDLAAAIIAPLVIIILMYTADWRMALAALVPVATGILAFGMILRQDNGASERFNQAQSDIAGALHETVSMIPVIKAYNIQQSALQRQISAFDQFRQAVHAWLSFGTSSMNTFSIATTSTLLFVLPAGLWFMREGTLPLPVFMFFLLASISLTSIGARLFGAMGRLRIQQHTLARLDTLLTLPTLAQGTQTHVPDHHIRIEHVCFAQGDNVILSDITLDIAQGQRIALVGPSGSGKSTLAQLLLRADDPQSGRIIIGGHDIRSLTADTLASQMASVFQEVYLFSRSIRDNIRIGKPEATQDDIEAAAKTACIHDVIIALPQGYDTVLLRGEGLSGGQKQRIALARALLKDAPVLILDEATAYADPDSEFDIQQALSAAMQGKTVIAIAHRLQTIRHFDNIVYMDRGHIVEQGTHDTLMAANGAYAHQWQSHMLAREFCFKGTQYA